MVAGIIIGSAIGITIGTLFWFWIVMITLRQKTSLQESSDKIIEINELNCELLRERNVLGAEQNNVLWEIVGKLNK